MIEAMLYDLDGVLVDATEWHYISLNLALKEVTGSAIERKEHISTFNGIPTMKKLEILYEQKRVRRDQFQDCLLYTSPSPRDRQKSRMPSSA